MPPAARFVASPPASDPIVAAGIGGLAVAMAIVAFAVYRRWGQGRVVLAGAAIGGWLAVTAAAAWSGRLARFDVLPPPMAILILSVFALAFAIGFGPVGSRLAHAVPLATLVGLQVFRLPLELAMHRAATLGIMPPEMSVTRATTSTSSPAPGRSDWRWRSAPASRCRAGRSGSGTSGASGAWR